MNVVFILCDTLRRDHCGPYTGGKALNTSWSQQAPPWSVPTPNMDRLGREGTVFTRTWCGSSPCMPARRDIYTGRLEFLERGWGPLDETDLDLPRQVSGPPNRSLHQMEREGLPVSQLISDHQHLWEQGSGNYHMGYTGFDFVRGNESDNWRTDPINFPCPPLDLYEKNERHFRHAALFRRSEADEYSAQVFLRAADWLDRNHDHENFYLHLDCFDPHEPWDPPEELLKQFEPRGYNVPFEWSALPAYVPTQGHYSDEEVRFIQARYSAKVVLVDRWLGRLLDAMDRNDLWKNTLLIFTTDHGTYNGDHGRVGKLQTHQFDAVAHIPFIMVHPTLGHGETRDQLVQLVDVYPTVLAAVGRPCPPNIHGINLLPILENRATPTRDFAVAGIFGTSVTITNGEWVLHQSPVATNQPLHWHGYALAKFYPYPLGEYDQGHRPVLPGYASWPTPTWLSHLPSDPNELTNLAEENPAQLRLMQDALRQELIRLGAPPEQVIRLGLD